MTFIAKERGKNERCFVTLERLDIIDFELKAPADLEHARQVAAFLNKNVDTVRLKKIDTGGF